MSTKGVLFTACMWLGAIGVERMRTQEVAAGGLEVLGVTCEDGKLEALLMATEDCGRGRVVEIRNFCGVVLVRFTTLEVATGEDEEEVIALRSTGELVNLVRVIEGCDIGTRLLTAEGEIEFAILVVLPAIDVGIVETGSTLGTTVAGEFKRDVTDGIDILLPSVTLLIDIVDCNLEESSILQVDILDSTIVGEEVSTLILCTITEGRITRDSVLDGALATVVDGWGVGDIRPLGLLMVLVAFVKDIERGSQREIKETLRSLLDENMEDLGELVSLSTEFVGKQLAPAVIG